MIIEKWIDDVFIWSSENGNLTLEIPSGWITPRRYNINRDSNLTKWKKLHHKDLEDLKKLSGNEKTLKNWREDQQKIMSETKKLKMDLLFVLVSVWPAEK